MVPISVTPLAAAAAPLLQLLARLRNTLHQPDAGDLRERTERELQNFEQRARELEIPMEQVRPAHFALCASIDDVVLDTPWGAASKWASRPLLSAFHQGASGAGQAFGQLQKLRQNADKFRPAIELIYLCISLGATGRSAASQGGAGGFDRIRAETYAIIAAQHQGTDPELSRRWKGVDSPYRSSRGRWPIWVVATIALAACGGLFVWVSTGLNAASDDLQARVLAASPARMPQIARTAVVQPLPPPPAPPQPTIIDRLRDQLRPEIGQGLVSVLGTAATPIVRITNRGMFRAGSASVEPGSVPLIERIAAALKGQAGTLHVIGYTDSQPIRTVRFPSNFQLSAARALAVRSIVARVIGDPGRVSSEGRADADPVASNATPEGREQNRRIEIVLQSAD
ncbi:MAG TPA: type VI secretion system protein TssL, long form [Acetobacteraceae bacterium]|nr:type VI secretion system protein TssL, long form [Acetobacteraceae bacterium]